MGAENVQAIADYYADAYADSNLNEKQIWEEIIFDSLGDMNIFAGSANTIAASVMQEMIPGIQSAAESVTKSPTQTRGSPGTEGKASREFWHPQLTQREWNLLNYKLDQELESSDQFIDSATKWLYADERGISVFAIYGIGDGTEATVLYVVSGTDAKLLNNKRLDYESGKDKTRRNPYVKHLERVRVEQNQYGKGIDRDGQSKSRTNTGVRSVSSGTQRGDNRGRISGNSTASRSDSTNNDARSKGNVSPELFEKLGDGVGSNFGRYLRRESGAELQADNGKSQDKQSGLFGENADNRGLNDRFSSPEEAKESGRASRELDALDYTENTKTEEVSTAVKHILRKQPLRNTIMKLLMTFREKHII